MKQKIRLAIIGMGGFAGSHQRDVKTLETAGECRLICACDPFPEKFQAKMAEWEYQQRQVKVFDNYLAMLEACADDLDMVVVPTPVPLHAPMHKACVERGLAVYLEKPPTLNYEELETMLAVEEQAPKLTQVGFNYIVEQTRHRLKQRILDGEFGRLLEVGFRGLLMRAEKYYNRANWAGRLMLNGQLVLDSGMGNAMAHNIHNLLFWAGQNAVMDWANIDWVEAEMYRAHTVQGTDTIFCRAQLANNIRLTSVISHACFTQQRAEWLVCEKARIDLSSSEGYKIVWHDGRKEAFMPSSYTLTDNHRAYYAYLRGERKRPLTRLADTRPFVQLCDLVYIAADHIHTIPQQYIQREILPDNETHSVQIKDLDQAANDFIQSGIWPSQQKNLPWGKAGNARATVADLPRLMEVVTQMAAQPS